MIDHKTSVLIKSQLPGFVRDNPDYANFVLFLEAYYEWLEQEGNVTHRAKNLLSYKDIDTTTDEFLRYFTEDFMPYFPEGSLISRNEAIKVARQIYNSKGTPASYKFLFRILYNSNVDIFYTKEAVFKASGGNWFVPRSLKLSTSDVRWLNIKNYRILGETTKSIATIENSTLSGDKIEVFISNIERLFNSGEYVTVVDNLNQSVLVEGQPLRAKIVGAIAKIDIDSANRGLLYQPGDPVIVYGGLNANIANPIGATASVESTTKGQVQRINVVKGGYGYGFGSANTLTQIGITNALGATAQVVDIDPDQAKAANVSFIPSDTIGPKVNVLLGASNYNFSNIATSNANTTLANALSFLSFSLYPLSSINVTNGGGGISLIPQVSANSLYLTDTFGYSDIRGLGILAPMVIENAGTGYTVNDTIVFTGGTGRGVYANITQVGVSGEILNVEYVQRNNLYSRGGMGYKGDSVPQVTITSTNPAAANAILRVPGILGEGATFSVIVDRVGAINNILVNTSGEDYETRPQVSLSVQDIVVANVNISLLPKKDDILWQGETFATATYKSVVDSINLLVRNGDQSLSQYNLRVFNYDGNPSIEKKLKYTRANTLIELTMTGTPAGYESIYSTAPGLRNYGDGTAKATAQFLNGLIVGEGQYLDKNGHPSSYSVLQSQDYNNFTYILTVEKEISKYREILLNLLHPIGLKAIGKYRLNSDTHYDMESTSGYLGGRPLQYLTGYNASAANVVTSFTQPSTNKVTFTNMAGANLNSIMVANTSILRVAPTVGPQIRSTIIAIDNSANTVTLRDNVYLTFANVAYVTANSGSNVINITSLTNTYNIFNNGAYSNTAYPLKDIVYVGDYVLVANNTEKSVSHIDYGAGTITINGTFSANANSTISVRRNINTTDVHVYNAIDYQHVATLVTEQDDRTLTTEDNRIIVL
jgi:hypothetical protein